jgi:HlyD family secretion protein
MNTTGVRRLWYLWASAALIVIILAGWLAVRPAPLILQGQVEATQIDVAAKVPGRVDSLLVREGETVSKGQLLAVLDSPEIRARLVQATSARSAAGAMSNKAEHGAREEEIRAASSLWQRAEHAAELAQKTLERVQNLHRDGVVSTQKRDEAEAQYLTTRDAADAARAAYDMARTGARGEDKDAAAAVEGQADGVVQEVSSYLEETRLKSPIDGDVVDLVVDPGELVASGYPVLSLVDLTDIWVTFNVREDELPGLVMGRRIRVTVPALGSRVLDLTVSYIAPVGEFATWRATNAQSGFDLKTFEVRARPAGPVEGLRPGMSALLRWKRER